MKQVPLTHGKFALVDDEDYERVIKYSWFATPLGHRRTAYARTNFKDDLGDTYPESMHRFILGIGRGNPLIVDHINGNGLDNRKSNLRACSPQDNAVNVKRRRDNKSGYKGVYYRKDRGVWVSEIRHNYKAIKLSYTRCKHYAARMYNDKASELYGSFAWINEVEECDCDECVEYKKSISCRRY